jgi:hypothetical protein
MAAQPDKIDVPLLSMVTTVGTLVCLLVAFGVAALLWSAQNDLTNERAAATQSPYQSQIQQQKSIVQEGAVDGMSIERAIDRTVQEG